MSEQQQKRIEAEKEYSIKGESLVGIVKILQDMPRSLDSVCRNIEQLISSVEEIQIALPEKENENADNSQ